MTQQNNISIAECRQVLGETALGLSDEQIEEIIAKASDLVNGWLDNYERKTFDGKTLNEILTMQNG